MSTSSEHRTVDQQCKRQTGRGRFTGASKNETENRAPWTLWVTQKLMSVRFSRHLECVQWQNRKDSEEAVQLTSRTRIK